MNDNNLQDDHSDDGSDIFEDAKEEQFNSDKITNHDTYRDNKLIEANGKHSDQKIIPTFEEAMDSMTDAMELSLNNKFIEAIELGEQFSNVSLFYNHIEMISKGLFAIFSLERNDIENAYNACERDVNFCRRSRKKSSLLESISKLFWNKTDYFNEYTDEEAHTELCYAESSLIMALLIVVSNQTFISLIKSVYHLKTAITVYRVCKDILHHKTNWKCEKHRNEFNSGYKLGSGSLNLIASHLPTKILTPLYIIGYSIDRTLGKEYLNESAFQGETNRSKISQLVIGIYNGYVEQILGLGKGDMEYGEKVLNFSLETYPNSAVNLWFKGRMQAMNSQIDDAIETLHLCISKQSQCKQIHNLCYWDILWCHALKCEWDSAAKYAAILRSQCEWSPATFCYMEATFLYMKMIEENKKEMHHNITDLFKLVPKLKKRYAGKTFPPEKHVCANIDRYFEQNEKLFLPAFDLFYIWNIFAYAEDNQSLINPMLSRIQLMFTALNEDNKISKNNYIDNYYHLLFLKGVCYMSLRQYTSAAECFKEILENETKITRDNFIPPEAALELGRAYIGLEDFKNAKHWLKVAENDYTRYYLKLIVQLRIHRAFQLIPQN